MHIRREMGYKRNKLLVMLHLFKFAKINKALPRHGMYHLSCASVAISFDILKTTGLKSINR